MTDELIDASCPKHIHDAGIRKAAILVASLDQAAADALLDHLSSAQAALVREAVMSIDEIAPEELQRVIDDFRRIGPLIPGSSPAGIELDGLTKPRVHPLNSSEMDCYEENGEPAAEPFGFLDNAEDDELRICSAASVRRRPRWCFRDCRPIGLVGILACFAPAMQVEVVRRLTDLEYADPEVSS